MRDHIFERIQSEDNLANLFNAYFHGLSTGEIMSLPYDSMAEYQRCWRLDPSDSHHPAQYSRHFYDLNIVNISLNGLHRCVSEAIALLDTFFRDYCGDFLHYATHSRMAFIEAYDSEETSDYDENGGIIFKSDPQSLEPYTLHQGLSQFFGHSQTRGEYIGSSSAEDFTEFTLMVANKTAFSIFKYLREQGTPVVTSRINEAGELEPMTLADEVESEINQDVANGNTAQLFEAVLSMGKNIRTYFDCLDPQDEHLAQYQLLRDVLKRMLAVELQIA